MSLKVLNKLAEQLIPLGFTLLAVESSPRGDIRIAGRTENCDGEVVLSMDTCFLQAEVVGDVGLADVIYQRVKSHMEAGRASA